MFHLGSDASLQAFDLIVYGVQSIIRLRFSAPTWSHRNMPAQSVSLATLFDTLISGVSVHIRFFAMQQRFSLGDVANVGYNVLSPYAMAVFPTRLAARGFGLAQAANGLGKIFGPLCIAFVAGSGASMSPKATVSAVTPAFFALSACGAILFVAYAIFAPEGGPEAAELEEPEALQEAISAQS